MRVLQMRVTEHMTFHCRKHWSFSSKYGTHNQCLERHSSGHRFFSDSSMREQPPSSCLRCLPHPCPSLLDKPQLQSPHLLILQSTLPTSRTKAHPNSTTIGASEKSVVSWMMQLQVGGEKGFFFEKVEARNIALSEKIH